MQYFIRTESGVQLAIEDWVIASPNIESPRCNNERSYESLESSLENE